MKRLRSRSSTPGSSAGSLSDVEHDLLVRVVKRVERVEELVLRAVLVRQELDVVDQQHVRRGPVARAEVLHRRAADDRADIEPMKSVTNFSHGDEA